MMLVKVIFYFFILLAGGSALSMLFVKNVFKGALLFLLCLLPVAGIFVLSFAEFIAVAQILIYAGGILVVIIFGIMLTSKISGKALEAGSTNIFSGLLAGGLLLGLLLYFISAYLPPANPSLTSSNQIEVIGINLMTEYALPFEIAGVLLLISLLGAAVITSFMKIKKM